MHKALDNFITLNCFNGWKNEMEKCDPKNLDTKLQQPVLIRQENAQSDIPPGLANNPLFTKSKKGGLLESNFDKNLLKILSEVTYWTKL